MASAKANIVANFVGSAWSALLGILFVPIYIRYLGVEAYGLIGFFVSIQAFIYLLDFGLSPTFNRELARLSLSKDNGQEMHDLKRTLGIINWATALLLFVFLAVLSPLAAKYWVQPKELSVQSVAEALLIMSATLAIQFFYGFYAGGLLGLQKQVTLNTINIVFNSMRSVGSWVVVAFYSPTIHAFLLWQFCTVVIQAVVTYIALGKSLYKSNSKGVYRNDLLKKVWRFAAGMTTLSLLAIILTQTDKIVLSKMLPLELFGYYAIAISVSAMTIGIIVSSITNVVYPNYSRLVAMGDDKELKSYYHSSSQLMSAILVPVVSVLAIYSYSIILLWQNDAKIASNTFILLSIVTVGSGFNGLITLPYHMQLAHGWTRLSVILTASAIVVLIPLMIVGVINFGAIGGAVAWLAYNSLFGLIMMIFMHRRILKGELTSWFVSDVLPPIVVTLIVLFASRYIFQPLTSRTFVFVQLAIVSFLALGISLISVPFTRNEILVQIKRILRHART
ncbi:MAG: oligosaccharide flippase family protein [Pyrinomonadaceae bacterium]